MIESIIVFLGENGLLHITAILLYCSPIIVVMYATMINMDYDYMINNSDKKQYRFLKDKYK